MRRSMSYGDEISQLIAEHTPIFNVLGRGLMSPRGPSRRSHNSAQVRCRSNRTWPSGSAIGPPVFAVTHNKGWQAKAACLVDDQLLVQTLEATAQRHRPTVRRPRDRGDTTR